MIHRHSTKHFHVHCVAMAQQITTVGLLMATPVNKNTFDISKKKNWCTKNKQIKQAKCVTVDCAVVFFLHIAVFSLQVNCRKMTKSDLPATDDTDSINSSLLSQSSTSANSSLSNRSLSSRSSFGFVNIGALHANQSIERVHVPAPTIPSPIHQEFGTLDAILVRHFLPKMWRNLWFHRTLYLFRA